MKSSVSKSKVSTGFEAGYESISARLRDEIQSGRWKAGRRLPTRRELQTRFRTTSATIQNALDVLQEQGFVRAAGWRGTFVADRPPHLHRYALIFHSNPADLEAGGWSHLHAALVNSAAKIQQGGTCEFEDFYGIGEPTEYAPYQQLVARMKSHQFAGLFFASHPGRFRGTPLVDFKGVPRVGLMTADPSLPEITTIGFDSKLWFKMAFDYLAARKRKKVAFISMPSAKSLVAMAGVPAQLTARGLTTRPYWDLTMPLWSHGAPHIVQLLMQRAGDRPDALVITDDNLVESTVAGLMAAGIRVPEDVEVVAHANFPRSGSRTLPLKWLGYDTHQTLEAALNIMKQQRRGEKTSAVKTIVPVFERRISHTENGYGIIRSQSQVKEQEHMERISKQIEEKLNGKTTNERKSKNMNRTTAIGMSKWIVAIVGLVTLTSLETARATISAISVDWDPSSSNLAATDVAGVVPVDHWNEVTSTAPQTNLKNNSGVATTAGFTASNLSGPSGGTVNTPFPAGADNRMMTTTAFDNAANTDPAAFKTYLSFTQVPYAQYEVFVYTSADVSDRTATFQIGSDSEIKGTGNPSTYIRGQNYVLFTGLTASSFTVSARANTDAAFPQIVFNGLEIVDTLPEPSVALLFGVGGLMIWRRAPELSEKSTIGLITQRWSEKKMLSTSLNKFPAAVVRDWGKLEIVNVPAFPMGPYGTVCRSEAFAFSGRTHSVG